MQQNTALKADIIRALRTVFDPEIPVNVYDLGLIYDISIDEQNKVSVKMTLTAPTCPIAEEVVENVRLAVLDVPKVTEAVVELVFDPVWDKSMMSEEAMIELGLI